LDDIAIMRGEFTADLLHRFFAFFGRQVAPAALVADVLGLDLAGPATTGGGAAGCRRARADAIGVAGVVSLPAFAILLAASLPLALAAAVGHVFHLLDQLVERGDDAIFLGADLLAGMAEIQPAGDIIHPSRNVIERIVFQARQIGLHQFGHLFIA